MKKLKGLLLPVIFIVGFLFWLNHLTGGELFNSDPAPTASAEWIPWPGEVLEVKESATAYWAPPNAASSNLSIEGTYPYGELVTVEADSDRQYYQRAHGDIYIRVNGRVIKGDRESVRTLWVRLDNLGYP